MKKYEDFIDGLQQEIEVPDKVWSRFQQTLSDIDNSGMRQQKVGTWVKAAAITGAMVIAGSALCFSNPVLAAKIPVIGKIFEQVQDTISFSGNYKDVDELKVEEEKFENTESEKTSQSKGAYTTTNNGVTITASEIYSDGLSIYLTVRIEMKKGGLNNAQEYLTRSETTSHFLYTQGNWSIGNDEAETVMCGNNFEGKVIDDNTFIGMIKVDKQDYSVEGGNLHLKLTEIGYYDKNLDVEGEQMTEGKWELTIPYSVDQENSKVIEVNKTNKDGLGIRKVVVSPYQVVVFTDTPYTTLSPEEYTKEEFEAEWGEINKQVIAEGGEPYTYEECLAEKQYKDCEIAVFNQDGKALQMEGGDPEKMIYAVQGMEITKLHIFMADGSSLGETSLINEGDVNAAKEVSVLDAEVDIKNDKGGSVD